MGSPREEIIAKIKKITGEEPVLETPVSQFGDYSTNIALVLSKKLGKPANEIAFELVQNLKKEKIEEVEIEAVGGFINFRLSKEYLISLLDQKLEIDKKLKGKKIIVEFAHPNTHKEFHIGHLRNITLGESIARLLEEMGADLSRVNYQGDVGLHVAKALYGVRKLGLDEKNEDTLGEKAKFLGKAYAFGSKSYEEDEKAKKEILEINKKIYIKDPSVLKLWKKTREWSLAYFDSIYKRVYTKFKRLYFESEVYESGKDIVLSHLADGIFVKSDGAIIFDAERYGLHKRVFITAEGNPTYEAKEMGLGALQYKEFKFDEALHVVGPEQSGYFEVVFKALELINPILKAKEKHLPYGFVQLKKGKMSSRLGQVVSGEWLLDEAKKRIKETFKDMDDETSEKVAVGAVKYSMLKFGRTSNIQFSFEDSISLEGDSGPYIQYTFTRTQSVLAKSNIKLLNKGSSELLEKEDVEVLRILSKYWETIEEAGIMYSPNAVCVYLFELAQKFNLLYQKHRILENGLRLKITKKTGEVIKESLTLLGIEAPDRM